MQSTCGFNEVWRVNYFRGVLIRGIEVEVRMGKLKNRTVAGEDEVTGEIIKGGDYRVVDWIWRLCNMVYESGGVL